MSAPQSADLLMHLLRRWWGTISTRDSQAFSLDWVNDYIQQVWYSSWVVTKLNDGTRNYRQCYGGYFNIWDSAVHGLDNRSVQTMKFIFQIDDNLNTIALASYSWFLNVQVTPSWTITVEIYWTWSWRITTTETTTAWVTNNVEVRVNNALPSWTARAVGDIDIFINWVKATKNFTALWNWTTTNSTLLWWAYNSTISLFRWRLYSFSLRNRALSDAECQAEWLSNWAVVTPSWLVNTRDTTNTSQAISRTWYNLNVSGNVSVSTDWDGKYILVNGNRDATNWTLAWTAASTTPTFTQAQSLTTKVRVKFTSLPAVNVSGIFWWNSTFSMHVESSTSRLRYTVRWSTNVNVDYTTTLSTWVLYDAYLVRDASQSKFFAYVATWWWSSVLVNIWWTTWPATFTTNNWILWDNAIWAWTPSSCWKQIYHARIRARALTQSEINADIALWNNTNNDPTIVASYRPDNLINAQFLSNTSDFTNAAWTKTNTTVTWDFSTAPDGSSTADRLTITWALHNWASQTSTTLTGSSLASKTIISKVFMRVASWTDTARIRLDHAWVDSNQYSWDLTVTTTRQEFTFTRTLTSGTGW